MHFSGKQRLSTIALLAWVVYVAFEAEPWKYYFPHGGWRGFLVFGVALPISLVAIAWVVSGFIRDRKAFKVKINEEKIKSIKDYLLQQVQGASSVEHSPDFDLKSESFKTHVSNDILLLKVSYEFIQDNDRAGIAGKLSQWSIAHLLQANPSRVLLLTGSGPKVLA